MPVVYVFSPFGEIRCIMLLNEGIGGRDRHGYCFGKNLVIGFRVLGLHGRGVWILY